MLRMGGRAHRRWLAGVKIPSRVQRLVFEEALLAERQTQERVDRLAQAIREAVPEWSLAPLVDALQAPWRSHALVRP